MKKTFQLVCVLALAAICALSAGAAEISYSVPTPLAKTNWTSAVIVPKFDPALGTLLGVEFTIAGHVEGVAKFESLDASPATITMNLWADMVLMRPDYSALVMVSPLASTVDGVSAFDGVIDFGGTSGRTHEGLVADLSASKTSPPPDSDLALFTGTGNINLWAGTWAYCTGSGSGNLVIQFSTYASAQSTVKYIYQPIPEPSSLLALMSGLVGIAGLVARRRT